MPASWVSPSDTYRSILRELAGYMYFANRLFANTLLDITQDVALNTQFQNMSAFWQAALLQAMTEQDYSTANVQGNTQYRAILRDIASQNGGRVFTLGVFTF